MGDDQRGAVPVLETVLQPQRGVEVEVVGGLVEEQQVRAAHQGLREIEPDPPPARELADRPREVFGIEPEPVEDPGRPRLRGVRVDRLELRVERRQPALVGRCRSACSIARSILAKRPVTVDRPLERAHRPQRNLLLQVRDRPAAGKLDVAFLGEQPAEQEQEEARLADSVSTHHAGAMPRVHAEAPSRRRSSVRRASDGCSADGFMRFARSLDTAGAASGGAPPRPEPVSASLSRRRARRRSVQPWEPMGSPLRAAHEKRHISAPFDRSALPIVGSARFVEARLRVARVGLPLRGTGRGGGDFTAIGCASLATRGRRRTPAARDAARPRASTALDGQALVPGPFSHRRVVEGERPRNRADEEGTGPRWPRSLRRSRR